MTNKHKKKSRKQIELLSIQINTLVSDMAQLKSMIQDMTLCSSVALLLKRSFLILEWSVTLPVLYQRSMSRSRVASGRFLQADNDLPVEPQFLNPSLSSRCIWVRVSLCQLAVAFSYAFCILSSNLSHVCPSEDPGSSSGTTKQHQILIYTKGDIHCHPQQHTGWSHTIEAHRHFMAYSPYCAYKECLTLLSQTK